MKHLEQNGFWLAKNTNFFNLNRLAMTLFFVASVTACNKEEFYQKDYLDNPFQDNTEVTGGSNGGDTSGVDGTTQGGVDSGVTSGTTNGTTGGSTTGDTTGGSTTGDTTGGATTGDTTGGTVGGGSTTGTTTSGTTTGDTTGGSTTGDTTGGSTTGTTSSGSTTGTTTSGSTTGSTTGGTTTGTTTGGTTGGTTGDCNNGHGNDADGVDDSNPGQGNGGPNGLKDPNAVPEECLVDAEESFRQSAEETKKIDILWVIDNSGSMADEQQALGTNFDSFIKGFIAKNVDFKMAITTTDTSSNSKKGEAVPGSLAALTSSAAKANQNQFYDDFMTMVKVGIRGSGYEKGLEATEGFVGKYASWMRAEAYLAVVVLSDEEDQSPKAVEYYTDLLRSKKAQDGLVKIYSIVNTTNANTGGNTIGHIRYKQASDLTAGQTSNIMDRFDSVLMEMGDSIINLLDSFALASAPKDGSLKVYVNGVETNSYSYDSASRSIKFDAGNLPPVGAQVTVKYKKVK